MKKILFLHGFGQSASIFEAKVGALRKDLQRLNIKTLFLQAPHALESGDGFAWWNASDDRLVYHGLNESIELLKKRHAEEAFDGIFGFSQGAAIASYIAGILEPQPAFLIVCGGFVCRPKEMLPGIANFRGTSLHIVGQSDQIVDPATSLNLFNILPNPKSLLEHPHGHVVPLQATNRKRMVDWINWLYIPFNTQPLSKDMVCVMKKNSTGSRTVNDRNREEDQSSENHSSSSSGSRAQGTTLNRGAEHDMNEKQRTSSRNRKNSTGVIVKEKRAVKKYCICQQPYNRDAFYIQCDACDEWFHGTCVKLPETLGEQIEKWFCPACVEKNRYEIKWKPDCARPDCKERVRTDNIYCSEECAILVAEMQLKERIAELPTIGESRNAKHPLRSIQLQHCTLLKNSFNTQKRLIRCLEFRQLLIDECIDRSFKYAQDHPDSPICGFDDRIVHEWIPTNPDFLNRFDSMTLNDYFVSQQHLSPTSPSKDEIPNSEVHLSDPKLMIKKVDGFNDSVCKNGEKCLFHEEWQLLKSREIAVELGEEIKSYCLHKQKQIELELRLLPQNQALGLALSH